MSDHGFPGTARFEVLRRLGAGGMGVVYEAFDRERNRRVALKTFRDISNDAVLRFKDEFRALQGVHHDNLVKLYELFEDAGRWFFTMELIDGFDFVHHVAASSVGPSDSVLERDETVDIFNGQPPASAAVPAFVPGTLDEPKLRQVLPQLVAGIDALHAAGKVHRDIKPQNVLVTRDNRVVLLDFGLVQDASRGAAERTGQIVGTVSYMAPEQAAGDRVAMPADWYAVGVLLYRVLTGRLPYAGDHHFVRTDRPDRPPAAPSQIAPGTPSDLSDLAMALLRREPDQRPTSAEIFDRLRVHRARSSSRSPRDRVFVGREKELAELVTAFAEARTKTVAAVVRGESGVGKSQLVRQFNDTVTERERDTIVLGGRCYERESVPYKAFDGIIDELARMLARRPADELADLLPERVAFAAQMFPVLRSVAAIAARPRPPEASDPQQQRALLFAAVRELFGALAARYRLVLVIDDLQWTDAESLALLRELLRSADAPPILYIATLRPTEAAVVPIGDVEKTVALAAHVYDLHLGALSAEAATELVAKLASRMGLAPSAATSAIAEEARGHPLFIQELVHHSAVSSEAIGAFQLDDAIMDRVTRLAPSQRRLIEIVTVAGRPLTQETIAHAAHVDFGELSLDIDALLAANLIKSSGARRTDAAEPYHDRVRAAVLARLATSERTEIHQQLAIALEAMQHPDPETLAIHWRDAGKPERAVSYALAAGDQAVAAVAFGRAARLYQMALDLGIPQGEQRREIEVRVAEALANDGHGAAAARAYLAAAADAPPDDHRRLSQCAAEQLLRAGHINEGLALVRTVLGDMDIRVPRSPRAALFSLLYQRAAVRIRGLRHTERAESDVPRDELERIDACWTVALLGFVDTLRGADFGARHLRRALAAGEPRRLARAVAVEAIYAANIAHGYEPRAHELLGVAQRLAQNSGSAYATAFVIGSQGVVEHALGHFAEARDHAERAEQIFRDSCRGVAWELDLVQLIALMCLWYEGKLPELGRRLAPILGAAQDRGDRFGVSSVQVIIKYKAHLMLDEPDDARRVAEDAMANWSQDGFQLQHRHALLAHAEIDLYADRGGDAHRRFETSWRALKRSLLLKAQQQRLELYDARGRAAIAAAGERGADTRALLAVAERYAAAIDKDEMAWASALATLIRAGVAARRKDDERVVALLGDAVRAFDTAGMALHAAIARRLLGEKLGGDEGASVVATSDAWLASARVANVARATAMIAPGFAT